MMRRCASLAVATAIVVVATEQAGVAREQPGVPAGTVVKAAAWAGIAPELLGSVVWAESGGRPWALNIRGAALYPRTLAEAAALLRAVGGRADIGLAQIHYPIWGPVFGLPAGGPARSLDQPPRRGRDPPARHGPGAGLVGRRGPVPLGHALAEVVVRAPRGDGGERLACARAPARPTHRSPDGLVVARLPGRIGAHCGVAARRPGWRPRAPGGDGPGAAGRARDAWSRGGRPRHWPGTVALAARPSSHPRSRP